MTRRVAVVGTDTAVGKTAVTCCLLRALHAAGHAAVPFKPAASGEAGENLDTARLLAAAALPADALPTICPFRYDQPLAPGIAHDPTPFVAPNAFVDPNPMARAVRALDALETAHKPDLLLIEGVGGLHVPMPGGTWLPQWLQALCGDVLVVGRLGLGTINHTLLTINALRALGLHPLGFVLVDTHGTHDPAARHNPGVLAAAAGCPHLGTMPHHPGDPDAQLGWITPALLTKLATAGA